MPRMSRLHAQQQRLFFIHPLHAHAGGRLSAEDGSVRALVLALRQPAEWAALAPLWQGVQADFHWPEPAIAVNGGDAFELWFSLADAVPRAEAAELLAQLQQRYLSGVRADRLRAWPAADAAAPTPLCRPFAAGPERWAAFVSPDLPAVFGDDPALDFAPGADAQAERLARLRPVSTAELQRLRQASVPQAANQPALPEVPSVAPSIAAPVASASGVPVPLPADGPGTGMALWSGTVEAGPLHSTAADAPRHFLLAVMNDASVPLTLRIDAAKALLTAAPAHHPAPPPAAA